MIQLNNGFEEYYYINEDGTIFDSSSGKILKPDRKHLYKLKTKDNKNKKISIRALYK